ncbi:MFS transporter [Alicyclobacillus fodiniaquatilis]|uniref:MFS transporter n=1 Tax=Alicyclobacillus fodiniaquatilis TaxID=1661150 RepID=A0ABW4JIF3_9BACL
MHAKKHFALSLLTILAVGPNLMLSVAMMFTQGLIQDSFSTGSYAPMWAVVLGNISFAVFVPIGPVCARKIGFRNTYVFSTGLFTLASLMATVSNGLVVLTFARMVQGAMTGLVLMVMIPILIHSFPAERRNRVVGVLIGGFFGAIAMGPFLGALAIYHDAWRWIFLISGLCTVLGLVIGAKGLPGKFPIPAPNRASYTFDYYGLICLFASGISLTIGMGNLDAHQFTDLQVGVPLGFCAVFLCFFVIQELVTPNPLLSLRLLRYPKARIGSLLALTSNATMIFSLAMVNSILRSVDMFSDASIIFFYVSLFLGVALSALFAIIFIDRFGPGVLALIGGCCLIAVDYHWGWIQINTTLSSLSWQLVLLGFGTGLTLAAGLLGAALGAPPSALPETMAIVQSFRLFFFSTIAPLFTWIVSRLSTIHLSKNTWALSMDNPYLQIEIQKMTVHNEALGFPFAEAKNMAIQTIVKTQTDVATIDTASDIYKICLIMGFIIVVLSILMISTGRVRRLAEKPRIFTREVRGLLEKPKIG